MSKSHPDTVPSARVGELAGEGGRYFSQTAFNVARRKTLLVPVRKTTGSGRKAIRGPVDRMRVGIVTIREWGRDVQVEIESLGTPWTDKSTGVRLVYGYPADRDESPGRRVG